MDLTYTSQTTALEACLRASLEYFLALSASSRKMHGTAVAFIERGSRDRLQGYLSYSHQLREDFLKKPAKSCVAVMKLPITNSIINTCVE